MRKVVTFLWFNDQAKEAVDLYMSLFDDAKIVNTSYLTDSVAEMAGKKAGDVSSIDFDCMAKASLRSMAARCTSLARLFQ